MPAEGRSGPGGDRRARHRGRGVRSDVCRCLWGLLGRIGGTRVRPGVRSACGDNARPRLAPPRRRVGFGRRFLQPAHQRCARGRQDLGTTAIRGSKAPCSGFSRRPRCREVVGLVDAMRVSRGGMRGRGLARHDYGRAGGAKGPQSRPDRVRRGSPFGMKVHGSFLRRGRSRRPNRGERHGQIRRLLAGLNRRSAWCVFGPRLHLRPAPPAVVSRTMGGRAPNIGPVFLRLRPRAGGARIVLAYARRRLRPGVRGGVGCAVSSVGRAPARHAGGRKFESCTAHHVFLFVACDAGLVPGRGPRRGSGPLIRIGLPPLSGSHSAGGRGGAGVGGSPGLCVGWG